MNSGLLPSGNVMNNRRNQQAGNGPSRRRPAQSSQEQSFLNMQRTLLSKVYQIYSAKNTRRDTHKPRTPRFPFNFKDQKTFEN